MESALAAGAVLFRVMCQLVVETVTCAAEGAMMFVAYCVVRVRYVHCLFYNVITYECAAHSVAADV